MAGTEPLGDASEDLRRESADGVRALDNREAGDNTDGDVGGASGCPAASLRRRTQERGRRDELLSGRRCSAVSQVLPKEANAGGSLAGGSGGRARFIPECRGEVDRTAPKASSLAVVVERALGRDGHAAAGEVLPHLSDTEGAEVEHRGGQHGRHAGLVDHLEEVFERAGTA